jgi:hypothetical protein
VRIARGYCLLGDNFVALETQRLSQQAAAPEFMIEMLATLPMNGGGGSYPVSTRKKMCALLVTYRQSAMQQLENRAAMPATFKEM